LDAPPPPPKRPRPNYLPYTYLHAGPKELELPHPPPSPERREKREGDNTFAGGGGWRETGPSPFSHFSTVARDKGERESFRFFSSEHATY
jgi:hypothetical protein